MDWQPIASAPKDGALIVVGTPDDGEAHEMRWGTIQQNGLFPGVTGMWVSPTGAYTWDESRGHGPTHWKPLTGEPVHTPQYERESDTCHSEVTNFPSRDSLGRAG